MNSKMIAATLAIAAIVSTCTGCGGSVHDYKRGDALWSTSVIAFHAKSNDQDFNRACDKLRASTSRRDELNKRINTENVTDTVREDLKLRRGMELSTGQELVDGLNKFVLSFERDVERSKALIAPYNFDPNHPDNAKLFDNIKQAEESLSKLKTRLATVQEAWRQYQEGKPLPEKL